MTLDVEVPDPPTLSGPQDPVAYDAVDVPEDGIADGPRREAIAWALEEGAWEDAFVEWAGFTDMTADEFRSVRDAGLIDEFDFYWHPAADDVGYRAPSVPADAVGLDPGDADGIEAELDALGRVVSERLENDYLRRDEESFGFFADE